MVLQQGLSRGSRRRLQFRSSCQRRLRKIRAAAEAARQLLDSFTCPITQVGLGQAPASKCAHASVVQERYGHTAFELLCCLPFTGLPAPRCLACAGADDLSCVG
jgi:hypothetical protein